MKTAVIIPTLNAIKDGFEHNLAKIVAQRPSPDLIWVIDSESEDQTREVAARYPQVKVSIWPRKTFDHAGTRLAALQQLQSTHDVAVFLTQDACPVTEQAVATLLSAFNDPSVAVAYGRQCPRDEATPIERFARYTNYPTESNVRNLEQLKQFGAKIAFNSDAFAAYRITTILENNGFPSTAIVGEDYITAANSLFAGLSVAYEAQARVIHSHSYSLKQELQRYFDIGVFHHDYQHILARFGAMEKQGGSFVIDELKWLATNAPTHIPQALIRTFLKYTGYRLGRSYPRLPKRWVSALAMHKYHFKRLGY